MIPLYKKSFNEIDSDIIFKSVAKISKKYSTKCLEALLATTPTSIDTEVSTEFNQILSNLGVENVYVLSLKSQKYKLLNLYKEIYRAGLKRVKIIDGVDAVADVEARALHSAYTKRQSGVMQSSAHISSEIQDVMRKNVGIGAFGYLLSQKKIFEDAISNGCKKILVFDDDVFIKEKLKNVLSWVIHNSAKLNSCKIIHLGASEYSDNYPGQKIIDDESVGFYNAVPHKTCGSFATIYDSSVYAEIIALITDYDGPFDNVALGALYGKYPNECIVLCPNIAFADVEDSKIRGGRSQLGHAANMKWDHGLARYKEYREKHTVNLIFRNPHCSVSILNSRHLIAERIQVNIFYLSWDGLRPLHSDRGLSLTSDATEAIKAFNEAYDLYLNGGAFGFHLPHADVSFFVASADQYTERDLYCDVMRHLYSIPFEYVGIPISRYLGCNKGLASIVMPIARSFDLVRPSIDSVLDQDYDNIELILVIDSPSKGIDLQFISNYIKSGIEKRNRGGFLFKIIQHKRVRFGCGARNTGLFVSSGEFISFIDDDDLYGVSRISKAVNFLNSSEGGVYEACHTSYTGIWSKEEGGDESRYASKDLFFDVVALNYKKHYIHTGTVTYRAKSLLGILGFDETYKRHQDIELNARYFKLFQTHIIDYIGLIFKPNRSKIKPTVFVDFSLMLQIKRQLLNDFSSDVNNFSDEEKSVFFSNHADDVVSLVPPGGVLSHAEAVKILQSYLC